MFNFKIVNIADFLETVNGLKSQFSLFPWVLALLGNGRCWSCTSSTFGSAPSNKKIFLKTDTFCNLFMVPGVLLLCSMLGAWVKCLQFSFFYGKTTRELLLYHAWWRQFLLQCLCACLTSNSNVILMRPFLASVDLGGIGCTWSRYKLWSDFQHVVEKSI